MSAERHRQATPPNRTAHGGPSADPGARRPGIGATGASKPSPIPD
ncbi:MULTISPECIES: hypothetical protein [Parafrankia]|nr:MULTISPECIES: hypothetical protein [Parafrankia]